MTLCFLFRRNATLKNLDFWVYALRLAFSAKLLGNGHARMPAAPHYQLFPSV